MKKEAVFLIENIFKIKSIHYGTKCTRLENALVVG